MADEPDIVSLGKPAHIELPSRPSRPRGETFMKYELVERIPAGPDDECYRARIMGVSGFERWAFVRRVPRGFDPPTIEGLRRQAMLGLRGVSQVYELGLESGWGFVSGELVEGASIAALGRPGRPVVSWLVALAIVFDACSHLLRVYEAHDDTLDLALTPARMIVSTSGTVTLCPGIPGARRMPWHRLLCSVIQPILALAATSDDERALLRRLFADPDPDAVWIASDVLVERYPELDPVLPLVFLMLAGRADRRGVREVLVERVSKVELRGLWQVVVDLAGRSAA